MINLQDPILTAGDMMFSYDQKRYSAGKPTLLLYASCHGRTLIEYFSYHRPDICERFNILRLETGPMTLAIQNGVDVFAHPAIKAIFGEADVVATYNMGARMRHHDLSRVSKLFRPDAKVITFVAPNFSGFCPFSYDGYASHLGILTELDRGRSVEQVWAKFIGGDFDPMFAIRWRLEMGRHADKESYHDIGLTGFIRAHYQTHKLWMGPSHPTYHIMAYIGSEIGGRLGFPKHNDDQILEFEHDRAMVSGQPETNYEFSYYKFAYPQRYLEDKNGYYRKCFDAICSYWAADGVISPQVD